MLINWHRLHHDIGLHDPVLLRWNILWIGVFGSFSRDQQGDRSDVDIIVLERSDSEVELEESREEGEDAIDLDPWTLEDLLPRVWCRPVQIVRIEKQELHGLVSVDALLTARTIHGNDQCEEILKLRQDARSYLEQGWSVFKTAEAEIEILKSKVESIGGFEEFAKSPSLQQSVRDDLLHIIKGFDIKPVWHPIHEGFWTAVIQPANELQKIITTNQDGPDYWKGVWEILTASSPKSVQSILMRLKKFVFPTLTDIEERIKLSERLEHEAPTEQSAIPLAQAAEAADNENQISTIRQAEEISETRKESVEVPITTKQPRKESGLKRRWKKFKARLRL
ncbi:uncharacterized protein LAJ45_10837 [Morchella importuna]|uniref:uncharacterized protein n=1 Tax=Morchella importuna TaxID=1174673 RepID=UPI001E8D6EC9|nr:uncharacterized protein LAJ45_10837 [Morchella importuna]KAH8145173.1 hypothetical protein LAJ45_10837 [Morchella importuna]